MRKVPSHRVARAGRVLGCAFALAVTMNLVAALWHPSGAPWTTARLIVSALFLAALGYYLVLRAIHWRQGREQRRTTAY